MKIATWNVNSIKARLEHVKRWLNTHQPDLLLIQELKGLDFPTDIFKEIGYHAEAVTQKAYNGVAILSKQPQEVILNHLPGDKNDAQARYLEIQYPTSAMAENPNLLKSIRVINIYLPNGNPVNVDSEKYPYKLAWMDRLYDRLKYLRDEKIPFVIAGDFNVIPADKDCHDPRAWDGDALFRIETHHRWWKLLNLGLTDAFRTLHHEAGHYSFWDYQAGAWPQNKGIRIDHFLTSPPLTDRILSCEIDKAPRAEEKASDHTPVILEIA